MFWDDFIAFIWRPWNLFLWVLSIVGFLVQLRLAFICLGGHTKSQRLSSNLQTNIFWWLMYGSAVMLWQSYLFITIDPMTRNVYFIFYAGLVMTSSGHALSSSITFLMFERVLIISKSGFHARHQTFIVRITILCTTGVFLFIILNATIREVPLAPLTNACQSFLCIMKNGTNIINSTIKTVVGATNVVICVLFISILFFYNRKGSSAKNGRFKTANMVVLYAIGSEVLFVIIPRVFELSCKYVDWVLCPSIQDVTGASVEVNVLFTGIVYMFVLKPNPKKQNSIATVSTSLAKNNRTEAFK